jgi:hypothetical protein
VQIAVDSHSLQAMREWARRQHATCALTVFATYALLVLDTCHEARGVSRFQSDGRTDPGFENTIGYLAAPLYMRVDVDPRQTFEHLVRGVVDEYCFALDHADAGYLAAQDPRPACAHSGLFNWIPDPSSFEPLPQTDGLLRGVAIPFVHPMLKTLDLDHDPGLLVWEESCALRAELQFSRSRHSIRDMNRFGERLRAALAILPRRAKEPLKDVLHSLSTRGVPGMQ